MTFLRAGALVRLEWKMIKKKELVGFVGGPWTILVYMLNKQSPKIKLKDLDLKRPGTGIPADKIKNR